jgi:exopolysaccharide production protein ExoZ
MTAARTEVVSIQYLRGCAALMVVLFHLALQLRRIGYEGYWPGFPLSSGVDIFFVISGFVMWITTRRGATTGEFLRRRVVRIVPLYWLLTTLVLAVLIAFPRAMHNNHLVWMHVVSSYLFFPAVHPTEGGMFPLLIPGWSLNFEMFFYVLFGLGLLLPSTMRLVAISSILCALAAVPFLADIPPLTALGFYTDSRVLEFAYGMALGRLFAKDFRLPVTLAVLCVLVGAALLAASDAYTPPLVGNGLSALLVVAGAVMIERSRGAMKIPALHLLGDASYSIYLSHALVLALITTFWLETPLSHSPGGPFVFGALEVAAVLTAGVFLSLCIERPLLRLGRAITSYPFASAATVWAITRKPKSPSDPC